MNVFLCGRSYDSNVKGLNSTDLNFHQTMRDTYLEGTSVSLSTAHCNRATSQFPMQSKWNYHHLLPPCQTGPGFHLPLLSPCAHGTDGSRWEPARLTHSGINRSINCLYHEQLMTWGWEATLNIWHILEAQSTTDRWWHVKGLDSEFTMILISFFI